MGGLRIKGKDLLVDWLIKLIELIELIGKSVKALGASEKASAVISWRKRTTHWEDQLQDALLR